MWMEPLNPSFLFILDSLSILVYHPSGVCPCLSLQSHHHQYSFIPFLFCSWCQLVIFKIALLPGLTRLSHHHSSTYSLLWPPLPHFAPHRHWLHNSLLHIQNSLPVAMRLIDLITERKRDLVIRGASLGHELIEVQFPALPQTPVWPSESHLELVYTCSST